MITVPAWTLVVVVLVAAYCGIATSLFRHNKEKGGDASGYVFAIFWLPMAIWYSFGEMWEVLPERSRGIYIGVVCATLTISALTFLIGLALDLATP